MQVGNYSSLTLDHRLVARIGGFLVQNKFVRRFLIISPKVEGR